MNIVSIKTGADETLRRVELSDGSLFSFNICYLPPSINESLCSPGAEGLALNSAEEENLRFASACLRAEKAALQLIARAEQNVFKLSRKLEKRGHSAPCTGAVISRLCETGILDDLRYSRLWLESRLCRQASSPRRLLAALRARGIDRHDAEAALKETLDDDAERQLLDRYVQKYHRNLIPHSNNGGDTGADNRPLRYVLKGEGFSSLAIQGFFDDYASMQ